MINIPPHLNGVNFIEPPLEFTEYIVSFNKDIEVAFVDDKDKCNNSVRYLTSVYVNIRGTYWENLIYPPLGLNHFSEAIVMRFIHEIGHLILNHPTEGLISNKDGLIINRSKGFWEFYLGGNEGDAWSFALKIRSENKIEYNKLVKSATNWLENHSYFEKDWDDDAASQWYRINKRKLSNEIFELPKWVVWKFNKYIKNKRKIRII